MTLRTVPAGEWKKSVRQLLCAPTLPPGTDQLMLEDAGRELPLVIAYLQHTLAHHLHKRRTLKFPNLVHNRLHWEALAAKT